MKRRELRKLGVRIWALTLVCLMGLAIWLMMMGSGRAVFSITADDASKSDGTQELVAVNSAQGTGSESPNSLSGLLPLEGSRTLDAQQFGSGWQPWAARGESSDGTRGPINLDGSTNAGAGSDHRSQSTSQSGAAGGSFGGSQSARMGASGHLSGSNGGSGVGAAAGAGGASGQAGAGAGSQASTEGASTEGSELSSVDLTALEGTVSHLPTTRKIDPDGHPGLLSLDDLPSLSDPAGGSSPTGIVSVPDHFWPTGGSLPDTSGPSGALDTLITDLGGASGGLPGDSSPITSTDPMTDPGLAALIIPTGETGGAPPSGTLPDLASSPAFDDAPEGPGRGEVPEPALGLLCALGLGAGAAVRRYRRRSLGD